MFEEFTSDSSRSIIGVQSVGIGSALLPTFDDTDIDEFVQVIVETVPVDIYTFGEFFGTHRPLVFEPVENFETSAVPDGFLHRHVLFEGEDTMIWE